MKKTAHLSSFFVKEIHHYDIINVRLKDNYFTVDLMDEEGPDVEIPIKRHHKHLL